MRVSTAVLALLSAGFAAAQSETTTAATTTSTSDCQAQNILDTCLAQYNSRVDACGGTDWQCLCDENNNVLTCYNNCPNDPTRSSIQNKIIQYCGAASAANTSSKTKPATSGASSATAASKTTASSVDKPASTGSSSSSSSTASASASGNSGLVNSPSTGFGAIAAGVLAVVGMAF